MGGNILPNMKDYSGSVFFSCYVKLVRFCIFAGYVFMQCTVNFLRTIRKYYFVRTPHITAEINAREHFQQTRHISFNFVQLVHYYTNDAAASSFEFNKIFTEQRLHFVVSVTPKDASIEKEK